MAAITQRPVAEGINLMPNTLPTARRPDA